MLEPGFFLTQLEDSQTLESSRIPRVASYVRAICLCKNLHNISPTADVQPGEDIPVFPSIMGFNFVNFDFWPWMAFDSNPKDGWEKAFLLAHPTKLAHFYRSHYTSVGSRQCGEVQFGRGWSAMISVIIDAFHHELLVVLFVPRVIGMDYSPVAVTRIKHTENHWNVVPSLDTCSYFDWPWFSPRTTCWSTNSASTTPPAICVYTGIELACSHHEYQQCIHDYIYIGPLRQSLIHFSTQGVEYNELSRNVSFLSSRYVEYPLIKRMLSNSLSRVLLAQGNFRETSHNVTTTNHQQCSLVTTPATGRVGNWNPWKKYLFEEHSGDISGHRCRIRCLLLLLMACLLNCRVDCCGVAFAKSCCKRVYLEVVSWEELCWCDVHDFPAVYPAPWIFFITLITRPGQGLAWCHGDVSQGLHFQDE